MDVEIIKSAIAEREKDIENKISTEKIIEREIQLPPLTTDVATVITGIRSAENPLSHI